MLSAGKFNTFTMVMKIVSTVTQPASNQASAGKGCVTAQKSEEFYKAQMLILNPLSKLNR